MKILNIFSQKYLDWPEYKNLTTKSSPTTIIDLSQETIAKLLSQQLMKLPIKRGD